MMKVNELIFGIMAAFGKEEYSITDFLYLLKPFDVTESSLRTNLSRMSKRDLIKVRRDGKKAYYCFAGKGEKIKTNIAKSFSQESDWSKWDNSWWGIAFSVPEIEKPARHRIRKKILAYRFVSLYPGFWIRPFNESEEIENRLSSLISNGYCKLIRFNFFMEITKQEVSGLWSLDKVNLEFKRGLKLLESRYDDIDTYSPAEALKQRMLTGNMIIEILFKDPLLPALFLPQDWKAGELKSKFFKWDRKITDVSRPYWKKIFM
jgi:phenylacetic acid degradation operon negative regulatory protein